MAILHLYSSPNILKTVSGSTYSDYSRTLITGNLDNRIPPETGHPPSNLVHSHINYTLKPG